MKQLSIIVPVYNVERYVRSCIESIYNQGLDENIFELIIINDGTKDRSMEMIEDIISQHANITVINQENQGLSVTRNYGIAVAKGEYIFMPDSDDVVVENSLQVILEQALLSKADLIVADFVKKVKNDDTEIIQPNYLEKQEKTGLKLFCEDLDPNECYVWHTLYKRQFITQNNICFIPNIYYQDIAFTHECYLKAEKCLRVNWFLMIYRVGRPGAATELFTPQKARDFCIAIAKTWELRHLNMHSSKTRRKLEDDVFVSFKTLTTMMVYGLDNFLDRLNTLRYLRKISPDLLFRNNIYQIATSILYRKMPLIYISIHYYGRKILKLFK